MPENTAAYELAKVRLDKANECLAESESNLKNGFYKVSANRSYYAVFHAMRAVLALIKFDSKKHSGVIATFRQQYIKTGIFPVAFSDIIGKSQRIRTDCDYDEFYIVSKEEVEEQATNAEVFIKAVEKYINSLS